MSLDTQIRLMFVLIVLGTLAILGIGLLAFTLIDRWRRNNVKLPGQGDVARCKHGTAKIIKCSACALELEAYFQAPQVPEVVDRINDSFYQDIREKLGVPLTATEILERRAARLKPGSVTYVQLVCLCGHIKEAHCGSDPGRLCVGCAIAGQACSQFNRRG